MNLNKIPVKKSDLAWRIIDGEAVIIALDQQTEDTEKINFLNETGTRIWELMDGRNSVSEIIEHICLEYEIEREEAEKEVMSFIKELKRKGLITFKD
jgi:hypothetical protein